MRKPSAILILVLSGILLTVSCARDEILHENLVVDGNTPPPSNGISTLQLNNYINNLYIDLFGRAPTEGELEDRSEYLRTNNYSEEARGTIIDELMESYEYYKNINILTTQKMLVDVDSITVTNQIATYEYIIYLNELAGDTLYNYLIEFEVQKLTDLLQAPVDLYEGSIGVNEYFRRFIYNYYYDEVNMGSLNFVVSCFENLFQRLPTDEETSDGIAMVDGTSSQLLLIDGSSKEDFVDIVTNHLEFYQGQVIEAYHTLLAREPSSYEMYADGLDMMSDNHFNAVKKKILQSEEYAGF
ncbi:MAG TPA: hypothetical protein PKX04_00445 [Chitinophagales bacterium]|nr:hypothetical protein [Chitinophagales bacterium]HPR28775.1 hypothetical protein [Chitinophagales bacterium]HQU38376.1 hypothetical protein [Chitinophagales bacterium]